MSIIFSLGGYCQEMDCTEYYEKYCEALKTDSIKLPNYAAAYFYSASESDSARESISECINNLAAFCMGVEQALSAKRLSIRQVGAPEHVSGCSYASYEKHGVLLIMTGDLITDESVFDENAGFNFVMKQRIQDSLGIEVLRDLGKKESHWLEIDEKRLKKLQKTMMLNYKTDSTIFLKIDETALQKTEFEHLEGVVFRDGVGKINYTYKEVKEGVVLSSKTYAHKKHRAYLGLDFTDYLNPNFCKSLLSFDLKWTVPLEINIETEPK